MNKDIKMATSSVVIRDFVGLATSFSSISILVSGTGKLDFGTCALLSFRKSSCL